MNILITFDSKYGNTETVAKTIAESVKTGKDNEVTLIRMKKVDFKSLKNYDVIVMGCPTHFGGPTRIAKKFIDKLGKTQEWKKKITTFDTYIKEDFEFSVKKMETRINEKISGADIILPGLSVEVEGMKGPISETEFSKCTDFGNLIVAKLKL